MESVSRFEDSGHEIVSMEIQNVYINRTSVIKYLDFRTIKMYGALFNYLGYTADIGYTNGCCVPQFIFITLHNPNPALRYQCCRVSARVGQGGMEAAGGNGYAAATSRLHLLMNQATFSFWHGNVSSTPAAWSLRN